MHSGMQFAKEDTGIELEFRRDIQQIWWIYRLGEEEEHHSE